MIAETATAVAEHGVGFVELLDAARDDFGAEAEFLGELFLLLALVRDELVQRRIDEADGDRESIHRLEDADEVAALERQKLVQSFNSSFPAVGEDHFLNGALAFLALLREFEVGEEHVLGAAEADAFGAEFAGLAGILRRVGIGANSESAYGVGPLHQCLICRRERWRDEIHLAGVDEALTAIERDPFAFLDGLAADGHGLRLIVNVELFGADDAALAPAAGDDCGVRSFTSSGGEDSLCDGHSADIFGAGFAANKNDLFALLGPFLGVVSGEDDLADCGAGYGVDAGAEDARFERLLVELGVDDGIEEALDIFRFYSKYGFFLRDQFFIGHVDGHLEGCGRSALAGAGLEHVELSVFNGELHVLHVAEVFLKFCSNFFQLPVNLGHDALHLGERHRRADAGDDVFALRVDEVIAVEGFVAGARVTREADTGAGIVAGVAENHLHDVDGGAEEAGDLLYAAIGDGFFGHPGAEYCADGAPELLDRVFGEVFAGLFA